MGNNYYKLRDLGVNVITKYEEVVFLLELVKYVIESGFDGISLKGVYVTKRAISGTYKWDVFRWNVREGYLVDILTEEEYEEVGINATLLGLTREELVLDSSELREVKNDSKNLEAYNVRLFDVNAGNRAVRISSTKGYGEVKKVPIRYHTEGGRYLVRLRENEQHMLTDNPSVLVSVFAMFVWDFLLGVLEPKVVVFEVGVTALERRQALGYLLNLSYNRVFADDVKIEYDSTIDGVGQLNLRYFSWCLEQEELGYLGVVSGVPGVEREYRVNEDGEYTNKDKEAYLRSLGLREGSVCYLYEIKQESSRRVTTKLGKVYIIVIRGIRNGVLEYDKVLVHYLISKRLGKVVECRQSTLRESLLLREVGVEGLYTRESYVLMAVREGEETGVYEVEVGGVIEYMTEKEYLSYLLEDSGIEGYYISGVSGLSSYRIVR